MRLAILTSHPIQYYAPLFREVARRVELKVFYANRSTPEQQAAAGFGTGFEWDVDLLKGYDHSFLPNVSASPGTQRFSGCDTPQIGAELTKGGFDALLVTGWHLKSYLQGIIAARRLGIRVLVRGDSHLQTPRSLPKRLVKGVTYPPLLRVFDAALYVGKRNREYYENYGYPGRRLHHSPHCVDTNWFAERATDQAAQELRQKLGISTDEKVVLFAGKLADIKRPLDIINAVAKLGDRGISVLVAGAGPLEPDITSLSASLGVKVYSLGFCNQTRMPSVYRAAQVLVLPSSQETWGLVCNEAIACGTPVIVSDVVGCAPDMLQHGRVAHSFPLADTESLSRRIDDALRIRPKPEDFIAASQAFGLEAAAAGIVEALQTLDRR